MLYNQLCSLYICILKNIKNTCALMNYLLESMVSIGVELKRRLNQAVRGPNTGGTAMCSCLRILEA